MNKDLEIRKKLYEMKNKDSKNTISKSAKLLEDIDDNSEISSRKANVQKAMRALALYLDNWYKENIAKEFALAVDAAGFDSDAYLDFRNSLFIESLKEDVDVVIGDQNLTNPDTAFNEPVNEKDNAVANLLNALIIDEWEAIKGYNDTIITLEMEHLSPEIISTLKDIATEENIHVGQLQKCLELVAPSAKAIKDGEKEAEEEIDSEV